MICPRYQKLVFTEQIDFYSPKKPVAAAVALRRRLAALCAERDFEKRRANLYSKTDGTRRHSERKSRKPARSYEDSSIRDRKLKFSPEQDIRGERLSDALDIVTHYVDDAIMLSIGTVRIIHGKGTGVLHEEIQKYLRTVPGVASVRDEDIRNGGSGVTIVTLD